MVSRDEEEPEPDEEEDLLVEQVDRKDTLDRVSMHVGLLPHLEVAQGDTGEAVGLQPPVALVDGGLHHGQPVHEVLVAHAEEGVEQEELTDGVGEVESFRAEVDEAEMVAVGSRPEDATVLRQHHLHPRAEAATDVRTVGPLLPPQVTVHLHDDVPDALFSGFRVLSLDASLSRLQEGGHVDADAATEEPPDQTRTEEEYWLEEEDEGHPLVVGDRPSRLVGQGHRLLEGNVVGVVDPADGVRVVDVRLCELGRAPAIDRGADVLLHADDDREEDEQGRGVLAAQAVDRIVVVTVFEVAELKDGAQ